MQVLDALLRLVLCPQVALPYPHIQLFVRRLDLIETLLSSRAGLWFDGHHHLHRHLRAQKCVQSEYNVIRVPHPARIEVAEEAIEMYPQFNLLTLWLHTICLSMQMRKLMTVLKR